MNANETFVKLQISNCGQYEKGTILIGDQHVVVYRHNGSNGYFYSLSSLSKLIDKSASDTLHFLRSKDFKAIHGDGLTLSEIRVKRVSYVLTPIGISEDYIYSRAEKGWKPALQLMKALMGESLKIFLGAFRFTRISHYLVVY